MAGIYIHIPFCRQACHYCDFHFSTNLKNQGEMVNAITKEIANRKSFIKEELNTIYFGGGTPSLLSPEQLSEILTIINEQFRITDDVEVTLEANPEDLTKEQSQAFFDLGINRLSLGMQTFDNEKLNWMNRIHTVDESIKAYENARNAGFKNISLDLIYAIPDHSRKRWQKDLQSIVALAPEHISLYGLTIEDKTVFGKWEQDNKLIQVPEDEAADQYLFAIDFLRGNGFIQYEVSNFGKTGFHSRHNNAYWSGAPYLGIGPGAHSFDGANTRSFNVRNNAKYLKALETNAKHWEVEALSAAQRINEQILTGLRTRNGINLSVIEQESGMDMYKEHQTFLNEMSSLGLIEISDRNLRLKAKGFLVADEIALRLFVPE